MSMEEWYYNLNTHQVESFHGGKAEDRLGPYATREEAEHAMDRFRERQDAWDHDPRFNDPEDEDEQDDDQRFDGSPKERG